VKGGENMLKDLVSFDPFKETERLFEDFFTGFNFYPASRRVPVNAYQTDNDCIVEVYAPNLKVEDINVSVTDGVLKIEGSSVKEKSEEGKQYYRREMNCGSFVRTIVLPAEVKENEAEAKYKNGVLTIRFPKKEQVKAKQIKVLAE